MAIFKPNVLGSMGKVRRVNILGNSGRGYAKRHAFATKNKLRNLIARIKALKSQHVSGSTLGIERVKRFSPAQQKKAAYNMRSSM